MASKWVKPKQMALLIWAAGLLLSALISWRVHADNQQIYRARLADLTDQVKELVERRFGLYEYGLRGTRGAVVAAGGAAITREKFSAYMATRDMAKEFPGARGFGFIRRLPQAKEARFLVDARAEGPADFSIRELSANQGDRFVIQYINPVEANRAATGLDVASETNRREAALAAAREGKVQLTAPITLVQAGTQQRRGFLAFLPIYRPGAAVHTPQAREAAAFGWAYAPLVVDDVLAGLGPLLQEIGIRLTDSTEQKPFFESGLDRDPRTLPGVPEASREITIFGRRWILNSRALEPLAAAARPVPVAWVGVAGASVSTVLALLAWTLMQRRHQRGADAMPIEQAAHPVTVRHFLRSSLARWTGVAYLAFLAVYLALDYQSQWALQMAQARRMLSSLVDDRATRLQAVLESRRKTMAFLAEVPPVQGLIRAIPTGIDPQDGSSRDSWELRLQQIFTAHLQSSPEVYQARFIGVAEGGRELIRVERRGAAVVPIPKAELQSKGNRPYMSQTLLLQAGEVWVSDLDLNQERGRLELPHRPTVRYSTPIYQADGRIFGLIIVNIDVAQRLAETAAAAPLGVLLHVTNAAGDFLHHPDPKRTFGFDLGHPHRWDDEYAQAELPHADANDRLKAWLNPERSLAVAATSVVAPNANSSVGMIRYTASLPLSQLEDAVWQAMAQNLKLPLAAGACACLLLYFYWASVQRQLQIRGQRLQLAGIVDQSMDAIIGLDSCRAITSWNRGAKQLFGFEEAEALARPLFELIGASGDVDQFFEENGKADVFRNKEFDCRGQDGKHLQVAMSLSRLAKGASSVIIRDVTEERVAQKQIVELNRSLEQQVFERTATLTLERQRLDNILRATHVGTWEWNVATGEAVFNARWAEMLGYRLDELMPISIDTWSKHVHPEDLPRAQEAQRRHFEGEAEYYSVENRMSYKGGGWVWVLSRGQLMSRTPQGAPEWMYGTHQDITAIKETELAVKRVASLLNNVLRSATEVSIIATDPNGTIDIFNAGAEQLLGYRADEMVGIQSPAPLHLPDEVVARGAELSVAYGMPVEGFRVFVHKAELEGSEQREWTYVRKDGSHVPVSLVVTAIRDDEGRIAGYLGIAQDISERLRSESALRHAKASAEAANAAKSMFLANMSHEIRTPMNAVIGVAHLLESTPLNDDQRQLLGKLLIAGRSLLGIINDVLDLSKIEAGEMNVEPAPMDPMELLRDLEQMFSPQAEAKGISLELHGLDALPARLMVDELRLRQVLVNLVSNAIKFTERGKVSVQVQREFDEQQRAWLRWWVRDSGVGISPEALPQLFAPFVQADASTTRRFGGTGLGLSIVRKLAELMGGEVGVQSEPGRGSEFWLRLPMVEPREGDERKPHHEAASLNVVVVDDSADDRRILSEMCRMLGWRALELASGEALVAHCMRIFDAGTVPPDALLVDWQMPHLDGLQALGRLADAVGAKRLPAALIISAHERSAIEALDYQHLASHILTKPVGASELFNAVNHSVSRHTGSTGRVAGATRIDAIDAQWLNGTRVLIVDDSDINLEVARRLLEKEGGIVLTATNGIEALATLKRNSGRVDAVLMDVQMPEMDGYEATRRIRAELGLRNLPILALTAGALGEERRRAEASGMNGFLTKPLDPQSLVRALRNAVEAARGSPLAIKFGEKQRPAPSLPAGWPEIDGIDGQDAAHRVSADADLFLRMLQRLLAEFASMRFAAITDQDNPGAETEKLIARLHKLRGSAGLLGARDVHRLAGEAESAMRAGDEGVRAQAVLSELEDALKRLEQAARPVIDARLSTDSLPIFADVDAAKLTGPALAQLLSLLRQQDLNARGFFQELAPSLLACWGSARFSQVQRAMDNLDFTLAIGLIENAPQQA